jgi:hypothetical protein
VSATNRGGVRVEGEYYPTPAYCTRLIAPKISSCEVRTVGEPCAGDGAILREIPKREFYYCELSEGIDYFKHPLPNVDLIITNPPYNLAEQFLRQSLKEARCVVYLLRINFLGSGKRKAFLTENRPTHLYTLSERPSFVDVCEKCKVKYQKAAKVKACPECGGRVKPGTDATEYAWFAWDNDGVMEEEPGIYVL